MNPTDSTAMCFSPGREDTKDSRLLVGILFSIRMEPDCSKTASWDSLSCTSTPMYNGTPSGFVTMSFERTTFLFNGHRVHMGPAAGEGDPDVLREHDSRRHHAEGIRGLAALDRVQNRRRDRTPLPGARSDYCQR